MAFYVNYLTVLYMMVTLQNVGGEIGVNCGTGAVVGQPYNMECTNIPDTVTKGINVFLEGESNSIIVCSTSKNCASKNNTIYSVESPHNGSLYFTIKNVTTDDIGKKLFCVDDAALDLPTQPSCVISEVATVSGTDNQPNSAIGVNCGPGAVVGQPYLMNCTNIPAVLTHGINVFLGDTSNSIIFCLTSKDCASKNTLLYSVATPHNESLYFIILKVTTDDIGKKLYCVDDTALVLPKPSCTISSGGLSGGEIAAIVVCVCCFVCIICSVIIYVMWKKKCCCFSSI